ncbi:alpha/beta hydrolase [Dongia soli]|uniref:Alpha/beta hydrolase n=2 Tax=Dongia soli TaxID=600628 RepID=A0ABU5EDH9_9PROT|nr:alpha/beta hydrolase [Dongia soli]MDY0884386.1 alpha/beta hydrolase [Dongia soli]
MSEELTPPLNQRRVAIGGLDTFLYEAGTGKPVLLLHGASIAVDAWLTWFRCFPPLAKSRRVISYDQPCFGRTAIPADGGYLDREKRADHAQAVLDYLNLSDVTLIGHSEGGFIATRLAIQNPGRVKKLIIVTSGGTSPRLNDARDAAWMAASAETYDYAGRSVDEDTYVRSEGHLRTKQDTAFETILRQNFRHASESGSTDCLLRQAASSSGNAGYENYTAVQERLIFPFLPRLTCPTLLVWAGSDATVPVARGLALADLIPNSEMHIFPRAGHWVMHEEAVGFNRLLDSWI